MRHYNPRTNSRSLSSPPPLPPSPSLYTSKPPQLCTFHFYNPAWSSCKSRQEMWYNYKSSGARCTMDQPASMRRATGSQVRQTDRQTDRQQQRVLHVQRATQEPKDRHTDRQQPRGLHVQVWHTQEPEDRQTDRQTDRQQPRALHVQRATQEPKDRHTAAAKLARAGVAHTRTRRQTHRQTDRQQKQKTPSLRTLSLMRDRNKGKTKWCLKLPRPCAGHQTYCYSKGPYRPILLFAAKQTDKKKKKKKKDTQKGHTQSHFLYCVNSV